MIPDQNIDPQNVKLWVVNCEIKIPSGGLYEMMVGFLLMYRNVLAMVFASFDNASSSSAFSLANSASRCLESNEIRRSDIAKPTLLKSISSTFYKQLLRRFSFAKFLSPNKIQSQTVIWEKLHNALSYKKGASKMLMKLTFSSLYVTDVASPLNYIRTTSSLASPIFCVAKNGNKKIKGSPLFCSQTWLLRIRDHVCHFCFLAF